MPVVVVLAFTVLTGSLAQELSRYALIAFPIFLLLHRFNAPWARSRKLAVQPLGDHHVRRDILYSLSTIGVHSLIIVSAGMMRYAGWSKVYRDDRYGDWWFYLSIPVMLIIHDTYFYWFHRLMHRPWLFKRMHRVHHLTHDPTPLTVLAFHPLEAIMEGGITWVLVLTIPFHSGALQIFSVIALANNIMGHLGYEFYPRGLMRTPLKWVFNTATNHHLHHQKTRGNYGLYFNFWDRLLGTNHPSYEATYEAVTEGRLALKRTDNMRPVKVPVRSVKADAGVAVG